MARIANRRAVERTTADDSSADDGVRIVDADVHPSVPKWSDLFPYLPKAWVEYMKEVNFSGFTSYPYPQGNDSTGNRRDATPPSGGVAGSDPAFVAKQLLDPFGISYAILNGFFKVSTLANPDFAAALASAFNDWVLAEFVGRDTRFKASITIANQDPLLAAKEIDRLGQHRDVVQILVQAGAHQPYGDRRYLPIWEAAAEHDLPVAIHVGGVGTFGTAATTVGWPATYLEWHTLQTLPYQAHVVSLVASGVFERFPNLRFILTEGSISWMAGLRWRMDKEYRGLRSEVPWLTRLPSEYIREHFYFTTQPIEEPPDARYLLDVIDMMEARDRILFSSDYPHWDFDSPSRAIPRVWPDDVRRKIFSGNALALYGRLNAAISEGERKAHDDAN